jgi:ubiquinone/menaquinone biosynthesis C-methylase UbiE
MSRADDERLGETRRSWNLATQAHNRHKRDQAGFLREGGSTLFPEETELVGELRGQRLLHLLCNAGQDTLSLASRGARVTGVDLSDEAITFATRLAGDANVPDATFIRSDAQSFLETADANSFDVVFMSYGALIWIADIQRLFRGIARVLAPGGRYVNLDFHPLVWCFDKDLRLGSEPYFAPGHVYSDPVSDYVAASGAALAPSGLTAIADEPTFVNPHSAHSYQHTVADQLTAMIGAGLTITTVREYPYANGCRVNPALALREGRRFTTPDGAPSLPLMLGVVATRP